MASSQANYPASPEQVIWKREGVSKDERECKDVIITNASKEGKKKRN